MLQQCFNDLVWRHNPDADLARKLWDVVTMAYSHQERPYHNLHHLEQMYRSLLPVQSHTKDWDTMLFALFYHDIVYQVGVSDNEEQSAEKAEQVLWSIGYPKEKRNRCIQHILATKRHISSPDNDTNYFTDADLSILGHSWNVYLDYTQKIRQEYIIFPDLIYMAGRKNVLQHFFQMDRLFKTDHFYNQYEMKAKENIQRELEMLLS